MVVRTSYEEKKLMESKVIDNSSSSTEKQKESTVKDNIIISSGNSSIDIPSGNKLKQELDNVEITSEQGILNTNQKTNGSHEEIQSLNEEEKVNTKYTAVVSDSLNTEMFMYNMDIEEGELALMMDNSGNLKDNFGAPEDVRKEIKSGEVNKISSIKRSYIELGKYYFIFMPSLELSFVNTKLVLLLFG